MRELSPKIPTLPSPPLPSLTPPPPFNVHPTHPKQGHLARAATAEEAQQPPDAVPLPPGLCAVPGADHPGALLDESARVVRARGAGQFSVMFNGGMDVAVRKGGMAKSGDG